MVDRVVQCQKSRLFVNVYSNKNWYCAAGVKKYMDGQLVATSIDVYLCMEYGDGGDVSPESLLACPSVSSTAI